jgi:hypothetical protein
MLCIVLGVMDKNPRKKKRRRIESNCLARQKIVKNIVIRKNILIRKFINSKIYMLIVGPRALALSRFGGAGSTDRVQAIRFGW